MASSTLPTIIPPGFRFAPSDEQLISYFLERKVRGLAIPQACPIWERELYGEYATPWNVLKEDDPCWEDSDNPNKKTITVFGKLKFVNDNTRNRVGRTAGCGTWGGKAMTQDVKNSRGEVIGHKKSFTFKPHKGHETEIIGKGHWIMHEFSLVAARRNQMSNGDYVICRISKEFSKNNHQLLHTTTTTTTTTTTDSNASSTTVETSRKRKSPSPSSSSCVSYYPDYVLTQKKACSGSGVQETMAPYFPMLNQETIIPHASQPHQMSASAGIIDQEVIIPYSSQPLPSSLVDDLLMFQQHEFAPAPWAGNHIDVENIDEDFWTSNAADVLGADFVI